MIMPKSQRVAKAGHRKQLKPKAPKSSSKVVPKSQKTKASFPHLCRMCFELTSQISEMQPTIGEAFKYGLRFERRLASSNDRPCSFCAVLFESLLAHHTNFDFEKLVKFVLVVPGPEKDIGEALHDLCALDLYLEGSVTPGHCHPKTLSLGRYMVSAKSSRYSTKSRDVSL
jgi:hypothetical protein